jgi:hypothetical protein
LLGQAKTGLYQFNVKLGIVNPILEKIIYLKAKNRILLSIKIMALSQNSFLSKNEAAPLLRQSNVENKGRIRKKCAKHPEGARRTLSGCCLFC